MAPSVALVPLFVLIVFAAVAQVGQALEHGTGLERRLNNQARKRWVDRKRQLDLQLGPELSSSVAKILDNLTPTSTKPAPSTSAESSAQPPTLQVTSSTPSSFISTASEVQTASIIQSPSIESSTSIGKPTENSLSASTASTPGLDDSHGVVLSTSTPEISSKVSETNKEAPSSILTIISAVQSALNIVPPVAETTFAPSSETGTSSTATISIISSKFKLSSFLMFSSSFYSFFNSFSNLPSIFFLNQVHSRFPVISEGWRWPCVFANALAVNETAPPDWIEAAYWSSRKELGRKRQMTGVPSGGDTGKTPLTVTSTIVSPLSTGGNQPTTSVTGATTTGAQGSGAPVDTVSPTTKPSIPSDSSGNQPTTSVAGGTTTGAQGSGAPVDTVNPTTKPSIPSDSSGNQPTTSVAGGTTTGAQGSGAPVDTVNPTTKPSISSDSSGDQATTKTDSTSSVAAGESSKTAGTTAASEQKTIKSGANGTTTSLVPGGSTESLTNPATTTTTTATTTTTGLPSQSSTPDGTNRPNDIVKHFPAVVSSDTSLSSTLTSVANSSSTDTSTAHGGITSPSAPLGSSVVVGNDGLTTTIAVTAPTDGTSTYTVTKTLGDTSTTSSSTNWLSSDRPSTDSGNSGLQSSLVYTGSDGLLSTSKESKPSGSSGHPTVSQSTTITPSGGDTITSLGGYSQFRPTTTSSFQTSPFSNYTSGPSSMSTIVQSTNVQGSIVGSGSAIGTSETSTHLSSTTTVASTSKTLDVTSTTTNAASPYDPSVSQNGPNATNTTQSQTTSYSSEPIFSPPISITTISSGTSQIDTPSTTIRPASTSEPTSKNNSWSTTEHEATSTSASDHKTTVSSISNWSSSSESDFSTSKSTTLPTTTATTSDAISTTAGNSKSSPAISSIINVTAISSTLDITSPEVTTFDTSTASSWKSSSTTDNHSGKSSTSSDQGYTPSQTWLIVASSSQVTTTSTSTAESTTIQRAATRTTSSPATPSVATIPSSMPTLIVPANSVANDPNAGSGTEKDPIKGHTLIAILLASEQYPWRFVVDSSDATSQLFNTFPTLISKALAIDISKISTYGLQVYQPAAWNGDETSLLTQYMAYIPSQYFDTLNAYIQTASSPLYNQTGIEGQLAAQINTAFPLAASSNSAPTSSSSSGGDLNKRKRNIIIGVCVGIGGALWLALIYWVYKRIKQSNDKAVHKRLSEHMSVFGDHRIVSQIYQGDAGGGHGWDGNRRISRVPSIAASEIDDRPSSFYASPFENDRSMREQQRYNGSDDSHTLSRSGSSGESPISHSYGQSVLGESFHNANNDGYYSPMRSRMSQNPFEDMVTRSYLGTSGSNTSVAAKRRSAPGKPVNKALISQPTLQGTSLEFRGYNGAE
ncbi:hypothetical protein L204_103537 [Cryptococcus depauperatus]